MALDTRLREGLRRSMSSIDTDAERLLDDALRRGHRRHVIRRAVGIVAVAATVATVAVVTPIVLDIVRDQRQRPATSPSPLPISPREPILGTWQSEYTCEQVVQAFGHAGVGRLAVQWLVGTGMRQDPVDRSASSVDLCRDARTIQRTVIFRPSGHLIRYQGEKVVDDCQCYRLIDGHTLVVPGDPGDPDMTLRYRIDGNALTFRAVLPDRCTSAHCLNQFAFVAVGQYTVGPWQRVDS